MTLDWPLVSEPLNQLFMRSRWILGIVALPVLVASVCVWIHMMTPHVWDLSGWMQNIICFHVEPFLFLKTWSIIVQASWWMNLVSSVFNSHSLAFAVFKNFFFPGWRNILLERINYRILHFSKKKWGLSRGIVGRGKRETKRLTVSHVPDTSQNQLISPWSAVVSLGKKAFNCF